MQLERFRELKAFCAASQSLVHDLIRVRFAPDAISVAVESVGVTTLNSDVLRDFGFGAVKVAAVGRDADVGIRRMTIGIARRASRRSRERPREIVPARGDADVSEEGHGRGYKERRCGVPLSAVAPPPDQCCDEPPEASCHERR